MVDKADLARADELATEFGNLAQALANLQAGGKIVGMVVAFSPTQPPEAQITMGISTTYMDYPAPMVDAIKAFIAQRQSAITDELTSIGVTGLTPSSAASAAPAPAAPATEAQQ